MDEEILRLCIGRNGLMAETLVFQVEEVSKHGLTKQHERKPDDNDDAEMEEAFAIRQEPAKKEKLERPRQRQRQSAKRSPLDGRILTQRD